MFPVKLQLFKLAFRDSQSGLAVIYTLYADFHLLLCIASLCQATGFPVTHLFNGNLFSTTQLPACDFHNKP